MKKLAMILSIFMVIALCSCSNKATREVIRDNPSNEIKTALSLDAVQNGKSLNPDLDRTKAFADVKIAADAKNTIFYQTIDLDEYMNDRFKQIQLKVLYFNGRIPSTDADAFLKEMNQTEYGLTEAKLGVNFTKTENMSSDLFGKLSLKYTLSLPKDFSVKENDTANLVVAYLPTYCIYNDGTQDYTRAFILVPIYYAFTYASSLNNYTSGLKNYPLELTEDGLLPSQSAE
ncbi:MAG: hypothetical protein K2O22_04090 [Anaeroplasmataceae bacterium]|nr:hypothetical protein [Anaeroplasmataceae bacterium]